MKEILGSKSSSLKGKTIVLGVSGSVAAVRSFDLCRELIRRGARVQVVASPAALELVGEKLLEFGSGQKVISELSGKVEHVKFFGKKGKADLLIIAPATANTISKIAMGIDDTVITTFATTAIGQGKPVLIAPAMHEPMYGHPIVRENLEKLAKMNRVKIIAPFLGEEKAKMQAIEEICLEVERALTKQSLAGKQILITGGATQEEIDPMRVLTSKASGKTGVELAREAYRRGAEVTLLHNGIAPESCIKSIKTISSGKMLDGVMDELSHGFDFFVSTAAVSDFSVKKSANKIKSGKKFSLELVPAEKIIAQVRKRFSKLFIVGFKTETLNSDKQLEKTAKDFLGKNSLQVVVANDVGKNPVGGDENKVLIVGPKKTAKAQGRKDFLAKKIWDFVGQVKKG